MRAKPHSAAAPPLPELEWRKLPLDGRVLIEASAGTGKTYNIGLIYLRLLLERELGVEQILVTTFTDAAAQELRGRLRARLVEAEHELAALSESLADGSSRETPGEDDHSIAAWLAGLCPDADHARSALRRIRLARADLDRAPISTIHSLCQRIQRDHPFESGAAFASDKLLDEGVLMRECVEDFWRRRYLEGEVDELEAGAVLAGGPEGLLRDLGALAGVGDARIEAGGLEATQRLVAELGSPDTIAELRCLAGASELYGARKTALRDRFTAIADILEAGVDVVPRLAEKIDQCLDIDKIDAQQAPDIDQRLVDHPLVGSLLKLRELLGLRTIFARGAVLAGAMADCREQMPRRAHQRNVSTFSMLIDEVHARLVGGPDGAGQGGDVLADCLFKAFPAALIDEFQDTDQRQFAIFDRIYRDAAGAGRGTLVMIGDPKQAIYGFRGGDIAAYLRARESSPRRYSLARNFRSGSALIDAINGFYARTGGGFGDLPIRYRPVRAAGRTECDAWKVDGKPATAPLRIHAFRGAAQDAKGNPLVALGELEALALDDCANRIAEQLNDFTQTIGGRCIAPGDIAVLVSTNAQIAAVRERLVARHVPCVGSGRGSVFESNVARDLALVLYGALHADDDRAVRGALATRLLGARYGDFARWQDDAQAFERELERFESWRELAAGAGVLAMIKALIACRGPALLAAGEGERTLTDLRHLGELLAEQEKTHHGLEALYAWLVGVRRDGSDGDSDAADARQLRIESDAGRVQLLTIHNSKGLEFPIVYLPLPWRIRDCSPPRDPKVLRFHDQGGHLCFDLGSEHFVAHRAAHFREDYEERLRLLYVALTRAIHAVHVYWVDRGTRTGDGERADRRVWEWAGISDLMIEAETAIGAEPGEAGLGALEQAVHGIGVVGPFEGERVDYHTPELARHARATQQPLPGLRPFQWLHSFSALARQATGGFADEAGAADEAGHEDSQAIYRTVGPVTSEERDDSRLAVLYALRGRHVGNAIHGVLEAAALADLWPGQRGLVAKQLSAQGVAFGGGDRDATLERIGRWLDRVRSCDLGAGFNLRNVPADARVAEFTFQFPVRRASIARLRRICESHGFPDTLPHGLGPMMLNGMLTGSADLVFAHGGRYHVLDYKTNWLGARLSDYRGVALEAAMGAHHYDLQALLYTVALHRYLRQRLPDYSPDRQLGENWYLFLRAVGLEPGLGVWRRRWPIALIEAIDEAFAGSREIAA